MRYSKDDSPKWGGRGRDRVSGDGRTWYQKEVPVEVLLWASTAVQPPAARR